MYHSANDGAKMILVAFQDKIGISRTDAENWLSRLPLSTEYAPTVRGVPRDYSRENVLELAFLAAMIRTGWPPRKAVRIVRELLQDTWGMAAWLGWPAGNIEAAAGASSLEALRADDLAAHSPYRAVSMIHLAVILKTVDALFAEKGES